MVLETDRVIIKTFNALVATFIHPVRLHIATFLNDDDEAATRME